MGWNVFFSISEVWSLDHSIQSAYYPRLGSYPISAHKLTHFVSARLMAAKTLFPHPHPLTPLSLPSSNSKSHHKLWPGRAPNPTRPRSVAVCASHSIQDHVLSSAVLVERLHHHSPSSLILLSESMGYSSASYYTSLGLFVISVPGLWSLIKRSVKSKVLSHQFS